MRFEVSEKDFFYLGLLHCGHTARRIKRTCKATNMKRFKDAYYATPRTLHDIFLDIQHPGLGSKRIEDPLPTHLLEGMRFLKQYPTKYSLAGITSATEKTALERVWKYVRAIQAQKEKKIVWMFDNGENDEFYVATVDGVHFLISEPRKFPSTKWFSPKYKKPGLTYEIATATQHNKIVWVNGPFPAGENDKKVFDKPDGLKSKLKGDQRCIADQGYKGDPDKIATRRSMHSPEVKDMFERAKARQETVNTRLKNFGILRGRFRTTGAPRLEKHKSVLEACLVIIQYELDNGSQVLFKV